MQTATDLDSISIMGRIGSVYILASKKGGTLYTGVTSDLARRIAEHEAGTASPFTAKYGAKRLVWYKEFDLITDAIAEEKRIKRWRRKYKINVMRGGTRTGT
ncbi:MAG: GIY-YIG nuclease family protein, partial [Pseudomonadota bacterium]